MRFIRTVFKLPFLAELFIGTPTLAESEQLGILTQIRCSVTYSTHTLSITCWGRAFEIDNLYLCYISSKVLFVELNVFAV